MLPSLILTATIAVTCSPDITPLECKLGNRILNLRQERENLQTDLFNAQRQLSNCHTAIELSESNGPIQCPDIQPEDTLSKPAIAGLATGAIALGAILASVAIIGDDNAKIAAVSIGGTVLASGWFFALVVW